MGSARLGVAPRYLPGSDLCRAAIESNRGICRGRERTNLDPDNNAFFDKDTFSHSNVYRHSHTVAYAHIQPHATPNRYKGAISYFHPVKQAMHPALLR